jgi:predicted site-specific integrase-resolvase
MKLSVWAKKVGVSYRTAWRWYKEGKLPVDAEKTPTGTIIIREPSEEVCQTAIYARVSSHDQKEDLEKQVGRLVMFANSKKLVVDHTVTEIGSALNGHRSKLKKLLANPNIKIIIAEHNDRLMRFGIEFLESALAAQGRKFIVVDNKEVKDDLVQDMIEILTSFCARLYGKRSAKNRARRAMESIQNDH